MKKISTLFILTALICLTSFQASAQAATKGKSTGAGASKTNVVKGKDAALETLGATSAMLLYNTYICIGSIADGYDKVNTKETVTVLMAEQANGIDVIVNNYEKLLKSGFLESESDKEFVRKAIKCAGFLKTEASSYKKYLDESSKTEIENYDSARKSAWALIEDLLGLKKSND